MKKLIIKNSVLWILSQITQSSIIFGLSKIPQLNISMETAYKLIIIIFLVISILWLLYLAISWIVNKYKEINRAIKMGSVLIKYYSLIHVKYELINPRKDTSPYLIQNADFRVFTKEELEILSHYLNNYEKLKASYRGTNKIQGI